MKHLVALMIALGLASPAGAACYADYKAKREPPLQLHYGVAELPDSVCGDPASAAEALRARLAAGGWTLLSVLSIFGPEGLESRKDSAGAYFLRY